MKRKSKSAVSIINGTDGPTSTLAEVVQYAMINYDLTETAPTEREYIEQQKSLKESLILQYKPEVLGEIKGIFQYQIFLMKYQSENILAN